MKTNKILILRALMKLGNFTTKADFARFLGISPQNLAKWFERNTFDINTIVNKFPEVNLYWLMTGDGEMLKESTNTREDTPQSINIPLLPISAHGESLGSFISSVDKTSCEMIISPIKGVDFAIPIIGDSMAPEYPSGSRVIVQKINENAFIEWGRTYVIDTCNGSVIKNLMPSKDQDCIRCVSINTNYPAFEINKSEVKGIYRVRMCLILK